MAAGAFVQGSSIELSADGPIREPYSVYFQGGLTWFHAKTGILMSLQKLVDALGMGMDDFIRLVDENPGTGEDDLLLTAFHAMNEEGRARLLQLANDMYASGHYVIELSMPNQD